MPVELTPVAISPDLGGPTTIGAPRELPPWVMKGRVPGLDGLRGVSILLVSLAHFSSAADTPLPRSWRDLPLGFPGVDVFFVISGFLITLLLIREQERTGRISLRDFYIRRALRILPAYVAYLAVVFAFQRAGWVYMNGLSWLASLTYTVNLIPNRAPYWCISPVWSLSVEEHFYLAWPLTLALLGRRKAVAVLAAWIVAAPALRFLMFKYARDVLDIDIFTLTRLDTIGLGCLLAILAWDPRSSTVARFLHGRSTVAVASAAFLFATSLAVLSRSGLYTLVFKGFVEGSLIAFIIFCCASSPESRIGRLLGWRPLVLLGVLSYSLYLWQPYLAPHPDRWPFHWPVNLAIVFGGAIASHLLVERPFLRLKDRNSLRRDDSTSLPP
jgi:peptidoglycan/LPS O-acetylase OafA/YrhL